MKKLLFLSTCLLVLFLSTSCNDDCETSENPICSEVVPADEECLAFFNRWFFDKETNVCQEIEYSGCSQKGFETQKACETCQCN